MGCSILNDSSICNPEDEGLVKYHAYTITKVLEEYVPTTSGFRKVPLIRLRNPWGQKEFTGRWSDRSIQWKAIPQYEKERIGGMGKRKRSFG